MKMKKSFIIFAIVGLFFIFSTNSARAIPIVKLVLPSSVETGTTFDVDVVVDGVDDNDLIFGDDFVLAFGFDVVTPASFTYNGASVWPGLLDSITFFDDSVFFPDVAGSTIPDPFFFGDDELFGDNILLATLSFTASPTAGNYTLGISSDIADPFASEGLFTFLNLPIDMTTSADITVTEVAPPNPVPEPATLFLLGIGLVGLAGAAARRRFKGGGVVGNKK